MGCGKSHVGRDLAKTLGRRFVDTDKMIQDKTGLSVSEIFSRHGESHFRKLETVAIQSLQNQNNLVVSLGGGAVMDPDNQVVFKTGFWVFIDTPYDVIVERVSRTDKRPLARDPQKMKSLYESRLPTYNLAPLVISNTGDSTDVVKIILEKINAS